MGKTHTEDERVYHEEMPKADTGFLDVTGRPICVGDLVAFNPPNYKGIKTGFIVKATPKMVAVEYFVGISNLNSLKNCTLSNTRRQKCGNSPRISY